MKQVMNYNKDNGLLNMIRRTDPMINGNTRIDVIINYGNNQNHSTNGGTKKNENN